jgi:S-adenosylmethionine:tRNA-ribosyltransferase-isomerase (queuine synthetase)
MDGARRSRVRGFSALVEQNDLLVFNDTRVIKARLLARRRPADA